MGKIKFLGIKNNKKKTLRLNINQIIWDKIEENINNNCIKKGVAKIYTHNNNSVIKIKVFPKVDDVCRYKITKNGSKFTLMPFTTTDYHCSHFCDMEVTRYDKFSRDMKAEGVIMLILESPHKDEYTGCFKPIVPANGKTGDNIEKYITEVLEYMVTNKGLQLTDKTYYLIISDPVPYQTSLHYFHKQAILTKTKTKTKTKTPYKSLRNNVWKKIWNNGVNIQTNFEKKIIDYDPDLIINACTSGMNGDIRTFLKNKFSNKILVKTVHPSAPQYNNNFGIKTYDKSTNKWI